MPQFSYRGRGSQGVQDGVLEAASLDAAVDAVRALGLTPVHIVAKSGRDTPAGPGLLERLQGLLERRIDPVDLLILARQLHTLLKSGVPILRALAGLTESAASQQMRNRARLNGRRGRVTGRTHCGQQRFG